nr:fibronectin type III domain-containing protein [Lactobacillus helveticus]
MTDQVSNAITGITRNRSYEVKLQALNGREEGPWSAIKTVFLK